MILPLHRNPNQVGLLVFNYAVRFSTIPNSDHFTGYDIGPACGFDVYSPQTGHEPVDAGLLLCNRRRTANDVRSPHWKVYKPFNFSAFSESYAIFTPFAVPPQITFNNKRRQIHFLSKHACLELLLGHSRLACSCNSRSRLVSSCLSKPPLHSNNSNEHQIRLVYHQYNNNFHRSARIICSRKLQIHSSSLNQRDSYNLKPQEVIRLDRA
jgi:hypothetical protein